MTKATTIRFTDEVFARLDQASSWTGLPVNSIVVAACLEWMQRHAPDPNLPVSTFVAPAGFAARAEGPPRWATIRRAVVQAVGKKPAVQKYPFASFTATAQAQLTQAQNEALSMGLNYIGTEHLLLASFVDQTSHAAMVLAALDVREPQVRASLDEILSGKKTAPRSHVVPTSRVKKVIELAFQLCGAGGEPRVSTGHLLLGLATEGDGLAAHVLKDAGATTERIREELGKLSEPET